MLCSNSCYSRFTSNSVSNSVSIVTDSGHQHINPQRNIPGSPRRPQTQRDLRGIKPSNPRRRTGSHIGIRRAKQTRQGGCSKTPHRSNDLRWNTLVWPKGSQERRDPQHRNPRRNTPGSPSGSQRRRDLRGVKPSNLRRRTGSHINIRRVKQTRQRGRSKVLHRYSGLRSNTLVCTRRSQGRRNLRGSKPSNLRRNTGSHTNIRKAKQTQQRGRNKVLHRPSDLRRSTAVKTGRSAENQEWTTQHPKRVAAESSTETREGTYAEADVGAERTREALAEVSINEIDLHQKAGDTRKDPLKVYEAGDLEGGKSADREKPTSPTHKPNTEKREAPTGRERGVRGKWSCAKRSLGRERGVRGKRGCAKRGLGRERGV